MIRRGFWLAAGAVLGISGYRRVTRLASALVVPRTPGMRSLPGTGPTAGPQMLAPPPRAKSSQVARAAAAARFVRDVRAGMAEYRDLHRDEPDRASRGRTLEGQSSRALSSEPALSSEAAGSGESQQAPREP
ncbi:MAG TPA: hypothetical protein VLM11_22820 [Streptosporangiaceae bacterium]|nr:hypothetical protein [Streptosporangiaceae bacterium]